MSAATIKKPGGCNKNAGPGPGAYRLPSTVGYTGHDATKDRLPAYSIGHRQESQLKSIGPGPSVMVDKFSRFGPITTPAYTMAPLIKPLSSFRTPGPGTYFPEKWIEAAPSFSLLSRLPQSSRFSTPAPNAYKLPSCLNGKVDHFGLRPGNLEKSRSPGPAHYAATPLHIDRWKLPMYSMAKRYEPPTNKTSVPGPANYLPQFNQKKAAPQYSFGVKHSDCVYTPFMDEDKYPPGC